MKISEDEILTPSNLNTDILSNEYLPIKVMHTIGKYCQKKPG